MKFITFIRFEIFLCFISIAYMTFFIFIKSPFILGALTVEYQNEHTGTLFVLFLALATISTLLIFKVIKLVHSDQQGPWYIIPATFLFCVSHVSLINFFFSTIDFPFAFTFLFILPILCLSHLLLVLICRHRRAA